MTRSPAREERIVRRKWQGQFGLETAEWLDLVDFSRNGLVAIDARGIVVFLNRTAARIIGTDEAHAVGKRVDKLIPNTGLLDAIKSGSSETNRRMVIGDHTVFSNRMVIRRGEKIVGAVGVFQDTSEIEKLSREIESVKALNRELDGVFESVDDGLVLVDEKGIVLRVNQAYKTMVGIADEEYRGKHVHELIREGYIGKSLSDIVIQRKAPYTTVDVRNGKELLLSANPVFNENGDVIRVVTSTRNTTELNDLKEKLAESEAARKSYYKELEKLRQQVRTDKRIVTNDPALKQRVELAVHVAQVDSGVLILGESGVGKDLFAGLIHRASKRALKPFVEINCAAVPGNLLESEFFGYEPGAFTGALKGGKPGLFELAEGGTLFLDEVGELPLDLQGKILKAVQSKRITRIGGTKAMDLDVRIIAATNKDLEKMVREKTFRPDLFYRLNVIPIVLPPLRERKGDIVPLINEFLQRFNTRYGYQKWVHPEAITYLCNYEWPGNVRELENTMERAVVTCRGDCIGLDALHDLHLKLSGCPSLPSLKETYEREERQALLDAYRQTGSTRKTAGILRVSQPTVVKKMKKYGIAVEGFNGKEGVIHEGIAVSEP
jgi:PAS domain S-box-containing protein